MTEYDLPAAGKAPKGKRGLNPKTMTRKQKFALIGIVTIVAFGVIIPLLPHLLASFYNGAVSSPVNVTTAPASLAIASVTCNGVAGTITNPTTASCNTVGITVGGSYSIVVKVNNTGGTSASTSIAATAAGGSTVVSVGAPSPSSPQSIAAGGSVTWTIVVTGSGVGSDTVTVNITA